MKMKPLIVLCGTAAIATSLLPRAQAAERRDYTWFLRRIMDLDRLPYLEQGVTSRQFSSYNRRSRYDRAANKCVGMDANGDAGHRLTVHFGPEAQAELVRFGIPSDARRCGFGDLEWTLDPVERNHLFFLPRPGALGPKTKPPENVVAAIPGPGCIYRIWSANPTGVVRFYFDGATVPLELDFKGLFLKGASDPDAETLARRREWPFIRPMTFRRPGPSDAAASDCYVPIPFARSCLVALSRPAFYIFGYKVFGPDVEVETFHLPLSAAEDAALAETCRAFLERGSPPAATRTGHETSTDTLEIAPGAEAVLADLSGPRVVRAFHARLQSEERYAHSKTLLTALFDDEPEPCVQSPLVNFFGTGFAPQDYRSYPLGYVDGEGYCYFPMPFRRSARFAVKNEGRKPVTLSFRIVHAPVAELPPNTMHFKCKYRREEVCRTFDYPFIECRGQGRFVGMALCIDDAWRSWWGEGDEKIWVDDDVFPSFFGTGSEDFFGDAWGIRTLHETFFACSSSKRTRDYARTCCYRWMVPDDVPFYKSIRATIENYPESQFGTKAVLWDEDYTSVAYWYQAPGGTDFFSPVPVEKRRPWGKVPSPPAVEAEQALAAELTRGARVVDDEGLEHEFSRGAAIDLGARAPGDAVTFRGPEFLAAGPYAVQVHTRRGLDGPAAFKLFHDGREIGAAPKYFGAADQCGIGAAVFDKGRPELTLRFTSAGRAVFDCFQFRPARQLRSIAEAEEARVADVTGSAPVVDTGILWSGGRQLRFPGSRVGDAIVIEVNVPRTRWRLCVGLTQGPSYGNYEASVNKGDACPLNGFAPVLRVTDWAKVGTVRGPNGKTRIRFTCTGKAQDAKGFALGLDYVGWQRIVVEDPIEGETAEVTDVRHGRITDQQLNGRFSGCNHLWFHPTKVGASFTWPLQAPADAAYELCVYFTKSWDYAVVRLSLDGQDLGEFDTYAPAVTWGGKSNLGAFELAKGAHQLKFEVVGKNEKSKGILVGVDCLTLKRK